MFGCLCFVLTSASGAELSSTKLRQVALLTIADLWPLERTVRFVSYLEGCLGHRIEVNDTRDTVTGGLFFLRSGFSILAGLSAPALALVEPTNSGLVIATVGNSERIAGTYFELVVRESDGPTVRSAADRDVAVSRATTLDEFGARKFLAQIGVNPNKFIGTDSDNASLRAISDGQVSMAVVRKTSFGPNRDLLPGLRVATTGPIVPVIGFARSTALPGSEAKKVEECLFGYRFEDGEIAGNNHVDRFIPLDSRPGLAMVREIGAGAGYRFDKWSFGTATLPWR